MNNIYLGQDEVVKSVLCALFAGGHVLLEGVPGMGKTLIALSLAKLLNLSFSRIQFTNDMLPSDVTGFHVFKGESNSPELIKGPVFAGIVLADEINRTSPKTQSALLEAMEEKQVSIDGITYKLPDPFMVLATRNPAEIAGTFPLPESQLDRFLLNVSVSYPPIEKEREILERNIDHTNAQDLSSVMNMQEILELKELSSEVKVHPEVMDYILRLVRKTRAHPDIELGASPRGGLALKRASQSWALLHERDFVVPGDVRRMAVPVLAHRIITTGRENADTIEAITDEVKAPV